MTAQITIRVVGMDDVLVRLNQEIRRIKGRSVKGLLKGAMRILRTAKMITPVDLGNLRNSGFVVWGKGTGQAQDRKDENFVGEAGAKVKLETNMAVQQVSAFAQGQREPFAAVGYGASYALYVHENLLVKHTVGRAKFLEEAMIDNFDAVLNDVEEAVE